MQCMLELERVFPGGKICLSRVFQRLRTDFQLREGENKSITMWR
jgi:hypothetical protein